MTKTLDTFLLEEQQKNERVDGLSNAIQGDKTTLVQVRKDYEDAVISDNDKDSNRLFKEMERLEGKIKADTHKLATLKSVTDRHVRESAITALMTFHAEVRDPHQSKVDAAIRTIDQAKQKYIDSLYVLDGLNEAYNADRSRYAPLLRRYNIDRKEIDRGNRLLNEIDSIGKIAPGKTDMIIMPSDIEKGLN